MNLLGTTLTYLGHSTFLVETARGKRILVDPWLQGNPRCPKVFHDAASDAILVTHAHSDHAGDIVAAASRCSGNVVGIFELINQFGRLGVAESKLMPMSKGGTVHLDAVDCDVTMTDARHSSSWAEADGSMVYMGEAAGYVVSVPGGLKVYFAGDTCAFGDMALIKELYQPAVAVLPIGDHFTMGPREAAVACRLLGVRAVVPCHFATFPQLVGRPAHLEGQLKTLGLNVEVIPLEPGQTAA
jgi:L-ascorbate metabolism protein UlaG (beta-lactamase superfamily)